MNDRLFERAVRDWLEAGSDRVPPAAIDAVLLATRTTPQERDLRVPRRFKSMTMPMRMAAGIAIVAVAGLATLTFLDRSPAPGGTPTHVPTTSPTTGPAATATATDDLFGTAGWTPFVSERYGYTISYPKGVTPIPASTDFSFFPQDKFGYFPTAAADRLRFLTSRTYVMGFAAEVPSGTSAEAWIDAFVTPSGTTPTCVPVAADMPSIVIDGRQGRISTNCGDFASAFFLIGRRMFVIYINEPDEVLLFMSYLSTVQLPEG